MERPPVDRKEVDEALLRFQASDCPESDAGTVVFVVAEWIIRSGEIDILARVPDRVRAELEKHLENVRRGGRDVWLYGTGPVEHTEFFRQLIAVMDGTVAAGSVVVAPWAAKMDFSEFQVLLDKLPP